MGNFWSSLQSEISIGLNELPVLINPSHTNEDSCVVRSSLFEGLPFPNSGNTFDTSQKVHIVLLSFLFFTLLFVIVNLLSCLTTVYHQLSADMEVLWTQTIVHMIFALIVTPFAIQYALWDDNLKSNIISNELLVSTFLISIYLGFVIYETTSLLAANIILQYCNHYILLHDIITLIGASLLLYYNQAHFLGLVGLLIEGVAVFRSLSWILNEVGLRHTILWKCVQHTAIHLYSYCPLLGFYCLILSYHQLDTLSAELPSSILLVMGTSLLTELFVVAPLWSTTLMQELFNSDIVKPSSNLPELCSASKLKCTDKKLQNNNKIYC